MACTVKILSSSSSSTSTGFVRGKSLYKETTKTITARETNVNKDDYSISNCNNVLNKTRKSSSLYTGSIFAAFNYGMQVK